MSGEAYEMPDGLLTMDAADAADAWYREASALRSRVEALEGALREAADRFGRLPADVDKAPKIMRSLTLVAGVIDAREILSAALQPDKGEGEEETQEEVDTEKYCEDCGGLREGKPCQWCRAALQADKGERCGGTGRKVSRESVLPCPTEPCPGCLDCREERCETCGAQAERLLMGGEWWISCFGHEGVSGCPPVACDGPDCKEDVR